MTIFVLHVVGYVGVVGLLRQHPWPPPPPTTTAPLTQKKQVQQTLRHNFIKTTTRTTTTTSVARMMQGGETADKATTTRRQVKKGKAAGPDWVLEDYDRETTQEPNIEIELRRLQALKSFDLLDRTPEAAFERFTSLAARLCGTPMALLSLVDLGRTYFVAHTGLTSKFGTNIREIPRKTSFCAHAILLRAEHGVLVVPDATQDARFATRSPWVKQYGIRFYPGAPLITPEGHRIGCLSVLDDKPHPVLADSLETNDLSAGLQELAAAVMDYMNEKRVALQAGSAAGLTVPYDVKRAAVHLRDSLHHLHHDADFNTVASDSHRSLLQSACTTADHLVSSVVVASRKQPTTQRGGGTSSSLELPQHPGTSTKNGSFLNSWRNDSANGPTDMDCEEEDIDNDTAATPQHGTSTAFRRPATQSSAAARTDNPQMPPPPSHTPHRSNSSGSGEQLSQASSTTSQTNNNTVIQVSKLVQNLVSAMEVFPKKVHLAFVVDPAVPTEVVCPDDLKVFRSSIALLTSACERTEQGFVRFRVYKKMSSTTHQSMLVFECEDTGRDVELDQYHHLFQTPKHDNKNGSESSVADDDNDDDQECITVDPETGAMLPKAVCQIKKSPVSNGFAVYPVARYVQSMGGEYGYMPRVARSINPSENVPDTGSLFWFSIPLREAISSLDAAIGTALGLDDDDQRQVVGAGNVPDPMRLAPTAPRHFY